MKRVLVVSPHFPPINAPDHQRIRMALPYLPEFGWEATLLTVRPQDVEGILDPLLEETIPREISICRTGAFPASLTRRLGIGSLALRSLPFLWKQGNRFLSSSPFDLVFFTTTLFPVTILGPYWRKRFNVPYVMDFQDPWVSDYHERPSASEPPGGRKKYGVSQWLARRWEPGVVRHAAQVLSVSPAYPEVLRKRYPDVEESRFTVLPFGGAVKDFETLQRLQTRQTIFVPKDGHLHWVYVGRGGKDLAFSLRALFTALAQQRHQFPDRWNKLRFHFIGTDYAPAGKGQKTVLPVAYECGVSDLVEEIPERISYFEALACMRDADALIIPGSDDATYTASKIYPAILSRKPLLAIFHEKSSVVDVVEKTKAGVLISFPSTSNLRTVTDAITRRWFDGSWKQTPALDETAFDSFSAKEMTRKMSSVFNQAIPLE